MCRSIPGVQPGRESSAIVIQHTLRTRVDRSPPPGGPVLDLRVDDPALLDVDEPYDSSSRGEVFGNECLVRVVEVDEERHGRGATADKAACGQGLKLKSHLIGPLVRCVEVALLLVDLDRGLIQRHVTSWAARPEPTDPHQPATSLSWSQEQSGLAPPSLRAPSSSGRPSSRG